MNPMSNNPSKIDKAEERAECERQLQEFLARGGQVREVETEAKPLADENWRAVSARLFKEKYGREKPNPVTG